MRTHIHSMLNAKQTLTDFDKKAVKNLIHQIKHVMKSMSEQELQAEVLLNLKEEDVHTFVHFLSIFDE